MNEPFDPSSPLFMRFPPTPAGDTSASAPRATWTVTEVTRLVKQALDRALPGSLHVLGEISNFKAHGSGHCYFTLKDDRSELACVMWRSAVASLKFKPADGLEVIATGGVDVFERSGRYQLYVQRLEPRGVGALELAFRQLKDKLAREGLFEASRKKPVPRFPTRIGLITSPTGAAVRDVLRTLARRYPCVEVLLLPVRVQGEGAAREIADAVASINRSSASLGGVDALIVARGGGSLEDLWAFNEEAVARAVDESRIPIISGVGHESDVTICDLVADMRAATPTAAAELAVPHREEVLEDLRGRQQRLRRGMETMVALESRALQGLTQRPPFRDALEIVRRREQTLDEGAASLLRGLGKRLHDGRRRIEAVEPAVERLAPHAWLASRSTRLHEIGVRLRLAMSRRLGSLQRKGSDAAHHLERSSPSRKIERLGARVDGAEARMRKDLAYALRLHAGRVVGMQQLLEALSYRRVLGRGFSITRMKKGRAVVRSAGAAGDGDMLITEFADGEVQSRVVNQAQRELFDG